VSAGCMGVVWMKQDTRVCRLYGCGVDETHHRPLPLYRGGMKEIGHACINS